ncbi:MAG: sugar phosphate isomerase/epimerase family protein [Blastochloris sp.]|mgnify:CR=1 FL=1|nr:sugar phosphate isomerase/epimerase family protein [Blastochloris sp.]
MKIGLRDYVLKASSTHELFSQSVLIGFQGVEMVLTRADLLKSDRERLEELLCAKISTGLLIPSLSLSHHNLGGISNENPAEVAMAVSELHRCFEWGEALGAKVVLLPFFGQATLRDSTARERALKVLSDLCPEAEQMGVTLAYEGDLTSREIQQMAKVLKSPAFRCYVDLANPLVYGRDPVEELKGLEGLVASVHIKDFQTVLGDSRPGEGRVPLPACAEVLRRMGYDGWLILETPPAEASAVQRDLDYVREYFL